MSYETFIWKSLRKTGVVTSKIESLIDWDTRNAREALQNVGRENLIEMARKYREDNS